MTTVEYYANLLKHDDDLSLTDLLDFVKTKEEEKEEEFDHIKIGKFVDLMNKCVRNPQVTEYLFIIMMQFEYGVINFKFFSTIFAEIIKHHTDASGRRLLLDSCTSHYSTFLDEIQIVMKRIFQNERSAMYSFLTWGMIFEEYEILHRKRIDAVLIRYLKSKVNDATAKAILSEAIEVTNKKHPNNVKKIEK